MQRIRTVKPELFRHEELFDAEKTYQLPLRLAFIGLFTCCDREGRFRWRPKQLKLDIFPYDTDVDMARVLDALVTRGFVVKYACGTDEMYGCIPSWHKHQVINHRESVSVLPGFEGNSIVSECDPNDASSTREAPVDHATEACPGIPGGKWNWKGSGKGNGREMELEREHRACHALTTRESPVQDALTLIFTELWSNVVYSHLGGTLQD